MALRIKRTTKAFSFIFLSLILIIFTFLTLKAFNSELNFTYNESHMQNFGSSNNQLGEKTFISNSIPSSITITSSEDDTSNIVRRDELIDTLSKKQNTPDNEDETFKLVRVQNEEEETPAISNQEESESVNHHLRPQTPSIIEEDDNKENFDDKPKTQNTVSENINVANILSENENNEEDSTEITPPAIVVDPITKRDIIEGEESVGPIPSTNTNEDINNAGLSSDLHDKAEQDEDTSINTTQTEVEDNSNEETHVQIIPAEEKEKEEEEEEVNPIKNETPVEEKEEEEEVTPIKTEVPAEEKEEEEEVTPIKTEVPVEEKEEEEETAPVTPIKTEVPVEEKEEEEEVTHAKTETTVEEEQEQEVTHAKTETPVEEEEETVSVTHAKTETPAEEQEQEVTPIKTETPVEEEQEQEVTPIKTETPAEEKEEEETPVEKEETPVEKEETPVSTTPIKAEVPSEDIYQTLTSISVPTSILSEPEDMGMRSNYFNQLSYLCKIGCPAFDEKKRSGKGIYLLAYSHDPQILATYYKDAVNSALKISNLDDNIPIAIATNYVIPDSEKSTWDYIQVIPDKHVYNGVSMPDSSIIKQHFTRALYLPTSPYHVTLTIDVSTSFCNKDAISDIITRFIETGADLGVPSSSIGSFYADNWIMLYRWNSRVKIFFRDWLYMLLSGGIQTQNANVYFNNAIHKGLVDNRLDIVKISPNYAFTSRCYAGDGSYTMGDCALKLSPVVNNKVRIVHSKNINMCILINGKDNQNVDRPRSLISTFSDKGVVTRNVVFSQREIERILGSMKVPALDWTSKDKPSDQLFWGNCNTTLFINNNKEFCGRV